MSNKAEDRAAVQRGEDNESLEDVLASIRSLVAAESRARQAPDPDDAATPLVLTPDMQAETPPARSGEILSEGLGPGHAPLAAPILDEQALREVINTIVREELQGELGDRISRNLRKLIRRELAQMLEQQQRED